jgi:Fe2+ or Zn2+ uptake regulation protein
MVLKTNLTRENQDELFHTAATRLKALGQRFTTSRRSLVSALWAARRPLTIAEIVDRPGNAVPKSSAYRNLLVLEQARVVHRIHTTDEFARYELAEDLLEHHHHLICSNCGSVTDFEAPSGFERTVRRLTDQAESRHGFHASAHRIDLTGLCANCV